VSLDVVVVPVVVSAAVVVVVVSVVVFELALLLPPHPARATPASATAKTISQRIQNLLIENCPSARPGGGPSSRP
jgi:hypothetical protein